MNVPAFNNYRKAAELGHPEAQLFLGECYANGTGTARDTAKAKEWFQKAAVQESKEIAVKAQFALAQLYEITFDGMEKAVEYYSKAAENGHAQAQLALAKRYVQQENYELAVYWLRKYLEKNTDPEICMLLADIYYEGGRGVIPDHAEAEKYYLMAAEKKHVEALLKLGVIYYTASTPDHKKAFRYFYEAAFLGNREAQYNLGVCYLKGSGTARDTEKAREWIRKAAVQGHPNAIKVLPKLN